MRTMDFAKACRAEKDNLLQTFKDPDSTLASGLLAEALLDEAQTEKVHAALDVALTDALFSLLVALDGGSALDGTQQGYTLANKDGSIICNGNGDLEAAADKAFFGGR